MPEVSLSDDARFVLRAEHVLRQAGWQGELFLGVKLVDPTWTRERWEQAQAALAQWQQQQGRGRWQGSGLEPLVEAPDGESETDEDDEQVGSEARDTALGIMFPGAITCRAMPMIILSPAGVPRSPLASGHPDIHRARIGSRSHLGAIAARYTEGRDGGCHGRQGSGAVAAPTGHQ